jgi:predicted RNA-binding protein
VLKFLEEKRIYIQSEKKAEWTKEFSDAVTIFNKNRYSFAQENYMNRSLVPCRAVGSEALHFTSELDKFRFEKDHTSWSENLMGRDHMENLSVNGEIIL